MEALTEYLRVLGLRHHSHSLFCKQRFFVHNSSLGSTHLSSLNILEWKESLMSTHKFQGRRKWHPTPALLPGRSHGRRSLVGCSPWGRSESNTTERLHCHFHFHALEKEMATHSSVLAWRIPGTGEPGGLPSMGSHTVGLKRLSSSSSMSSSPCSATGHH